MNTISKINFVFKVKVTIQAYRFCFSALFGESGARVGAENTKSVSTSLILRLLAPLCLIDLLTGGENTKLSSTLSVTSEK